MEKQLKLTHEQQVLLEIETARVRYAWAKDELKRAGSSPALKKYVAESRDELRTLKAKQKRPKS